MSHSIPQDLETRIDQLSPGEKQNLVERLVHDLRKANGANAEFAATLASMAADPDIQREIREINHRW